MRSGYVSSWFFIAAVLGGCMAPTADEGVGDELDTDADDTSADSVSSPLNHGELVFGQPNAAHIGPRRYHAWQLTLEGDAGVSLTTGPETDDGPVVDTVLALYRRGGNGRWGRALARNDDHDGSSRARTVSPLGSASSATGTRLALVLVDPVARSVSISTTTPGAVWRSVSE
jgi:hypothetical protein